MIGITERGDAGLDFSWVKQIPALDFAVIITKNLNDTFINHAINNKNKIIVHATITGHGGTILEPYVPDTDWSISQLKKLVDLGFPVQQIVLRVDPIIPTDDGIKKAINVLEKASGIGIVRCRVSVMDMYRHVAIRFAKAGISMPEYNLRACYMNVAHELIPYMDRWEFEACAEDFPFKLGCISQKDADILGSKVKLMGSSGQRRGCLCPANKTELLSNKSQCYHRCLYCYWPYEYSDRKE